MAFPAPLQSVTVTLGPVLDVEGNPISGELLVMRLSAPVRIVGSGSLIPSVAATYTDADGVASLEVVATDSAGIDRHDWTYRLTSPTHAAVPVALPASVPTARVEDLVTVPYSGGDVVWLPADLAEIISGGGLGSLSSVPVGTALPDSSTPGPLYIHKVAI
jgi:hypothetical protein